MTSPTTVIDPSVLAQLDYPDNPALLLSRLPALRRHLKGDGSTRQHLRIAVLGASTTHDLIALMELFLLKEGIESEFYESEYNRYYEDALFPPQELLDFKPELVFIHSSSRAVTSKPRPGDDKKNIDQALTEENSRFERMWLSLHERFGCLVIQNNFEQPPYALLGNRDCADPHGFTRYLSHLNERFYDYSRGHDYLHIHDLARCAADYGLKNWHDEAAWCSWKYVCALNALPAMAFSVTRIIKALLGRNKKVLCLDLDNTLWGGVVGDDGPEGLSMGPETAAGEAYTAFQRYLLELRDIGVLLTVSSKNDEENALKGLNHPSCLLKPEVFAQLTANWEPKSKAIKKQAVTLNLLPESFVLADDNPAERLEVAQSIPGVSTVPLSSPEHYVQELSRRGYFETVSLTQDDLTRAAMYAQNSQRTAAQTDFRSYDDYLRSLEMTAKIEPFAPPYLPRIAQLTNKSNQFNLTTKRYTLAQIESAAADPELITLSVSLRDRFGDNGIVALAIARVNEPNSSADIELLLMSCRVLRRGVEYALLDALVQRCRSRGLRNLTAHYISSAKNALVKELCKDLGFTPLADFQGDYPQGTTHWQLTVNDFRSLPYFITLNLPDSGILAVSFPNLWC